MVKYLQKGKNIQNRLDSMLKLLAILSILVGLVIVIWTAAELIYPH